MIYINLGIFILILTAIFYLSNTTTIKAQNQFCQRLVMHSYLNAEDSCKFYISKCNDTHK